MFTSVNAASSKIR